MKPKLLTMSAFGSYGGVTQIDFERAGIVPDHGRYGGRQNDDL